MVGAFRFKHLMNFVRLYFRKDERKTETAQEILDGFKMKFMVAITVVFFGSMVAAFIWLFIKSSL